MREVEARSMRLLERSATVSMLLLLSMACSLGMGCRNHGDGQSEEPNGSSLLTQLPIPEGAIDLSRSQHASELASLSYSIRDRERGDEIAALYGEFFSLKGWERTDNWDNRWESQQRVLHEAFVTMRQFMTSWRSPEGELEAGLVVWYDNAPRGSLHVQIHLAPAIDHSRLEAFTERLEEEGASEFFDVLQPHMDSAGRIDFEAAREAYPEWEGYLREFEEICKCASENP